MAGPNPKPPVNFVVRLDGSHIRPWAVPLRKLTEVMNAVQRLVEQRDEFAADDSEGDSGQDSPLQLLQITSGSAAYRVSAADPDRAIRVLTETGDSITRPDAVDWTSATLSSVEELSHVAKSLGCRIELRRPDQAGKKGPVLATIGPETYGEISANAFITGETSLFGRIERVGGAGSMHCGLRIATQRRMIICKVGGEELTRKLGQFVYQHVVVHGEATWVKRGQHVRAFHIKSVEPPKSQSLTEGLKDLHDAGGDAWERIDDPAAFLAEMRS